MYQLEENKFWLFKKSVTKEKKKKKKSLFTFKIDG